MKTMGNQWENMKTMGNIYKALSATVQDIDWSFKCVKFVCKFGAVHFLGVRYAPLFVMDQNLDNI